MDEFLAALAATDIATALRQSRWGYAAVNATHILGLALLVGAIVPLDLKLIGFWREENRDALVRVLVPCAAAGLAIASLAGLLLFSVRAPEYAKNPAFLTKIALVAAGTGSALFHHIMYGRNLTAASPGQLKAAGLISLACWLGALVSGRLIAFFAD